MPRERGSPPIRVWALLGARAGDNDQVIALAEATGLPFEIKQLRYNGLHRLGPRLLGASLASLTGSSRAEILGDPPPDLTISAGHRSVPVVRVLQRLSAGRTRSIHVGFPRVSPGHFDLVIATPQYPIEDHPSLLRVPFALTTTATARRSGSEPPDIALPPAPRRLLMVGGPNIYWKLDEEALFQTIGEMLDDAHANGGSVIVTTSPRTPVNVREHIQSKLSASDVATRFVKPGEPPSYPELLASANSIRITADSVAMVSDAIWTGKPIALVRVIPRALGSIGMGVNDRLRPGRRLYPQDLRYFWTALHDIGVTGDLSTPRVHPKDQWSSVVDRVTAILSS